MRVVEVTEYGHVKSVPLDAEQRDALIESGWFDLIPERGRDGLWTIRATSHVGEFVVPDLTIRVRPKLEVAQLFVMLSAALDSIAWFDHKLERSASLAIEDIIASALVDSIARSLRRGLLRGYVATEEESSVIRGRLRLTEALRRRGGVLVPIVQEPHILDESIPENRVMATALSRLAARVQSRSVRGRVLDCQRAFGGVATLPASAPIPRLDRTRLNAPWWNSIELALLVLRSCGLDLRHGSHQSRSFMVDMNVVFERFVHSCLASALDRHGHVLKHNCGGLHLDVESRHRLRPDLSIWSHAHCVFAADCKYKISDDGSAAREDLYQSLAYALATGTRRVMIIYGGDSIRSREVLVADRRTIIQVRVVNLAAPPEQLKNQFANIADEIAESIRIG